MLSHVGRFASGLRRARRRVERAGQVGVRMREKGRKMATEPRSGTKRRGPGAPAEGAPGKRPGREFRTRARRGRSVPERGSVAIFRVKSCTATRGTAKRDERAGAPSRDKSATKGRFPVALPFCHALRQFDSMSSWVSTGASLCRTASHLCRNPPAAPTSGTPPRRPLG